MTVRYEIEVVSRLPRFGEYTFENAHQFQSRHFSLARVLAFKRPSLHIAASRLGLGAIIRRDPAESNFLPLSCSSAAVHGSYYPFNAYGDTWRRFDPSATLHVVRMVAESRDTAAWSRSQWKYVGREYQVVAEVKVTDLRTPTPTEYAHNGPRGGRGFNQGTLRSRIIKALADPRYPDRIWSS